MARPRALSDDQVAQLRKKFTSCPQKADLVAFAKSRRWKVGASTLDNYRRELWGPDSEDPGNRVRKAVQKPPAGPAAPDQAEVAIDHPAVLREQLARAQQMARSERDPRVLTPLIRVIADLSEALREMEKQGATDTGPRRVFFFPELTQIERLESDEP